MGSESRRIRGIEEKRIGVVEYSFGFGCALIFNKTHQAPWSILIEVILCQFPVRTFGLIIRCSCVSYRTNPKLFKWVIYVELPLKLVVVVGNYFF